MNRGEEKGRPTDGGRAGRPMLEYVDMLLNHVERLKARKAADPNIFQN